MSYSVAWTNDALFSLAAIWLRAWDRQAVTSAQVAIDRALGENPLGNGRHVSEGLYAIDVPPLRAQFEISDSARIVTVVSVRELP